MVLKGLGTERKFKKYGIEKVGQNLYLKLIFNEGKAEEIFSIFLLSMRRIISSNVLLTCNKRGLANF